MIRTSSAYTQVPVAHKLDTNTRHRYTDVVKQGDQLITKLQKYGQVVRLRGSERT